jgi:asparagine synthase (glutamine-hydrolysing)
VLKEALKGRVPKPIFDRPKMGFSIPLADWLRGPFRPRLESAIAGALLNGCGWFEPAALARLSAAHQSGRSDHSAELWALLMFEGFLRTLAPG